MGSPLFEVLMRFDYWARLAEQAGLMMKLTTGSKFDAASVDPVTELQDPNTRRKLRRFSQRLLALSCAPDQITPE
jgi:hypothetical protein